MACCAKLKMCRWAARACSPMSRESIAFIKVAGRPSSGRRFLHQHGKRLTRTALTSTTACANFRSRKSLVTKISLAQS